MKSKILLSFIALALAVMAVSSSIGSETVSAAHLKDKLERWRSLSQEEVLSAFTNDTGSFLKTVSLTRENMQYLIEQTDQSTISFELAIDGNGQFGLILDQAIQTSNHGFESSLPNLKNKLTSFDLEGYNKAHTSLEPGAKEHLIGLELAIEEIEKWETASNEEKLNGIVAENGERLLSLAYNREVFETLLSQPKVASVTSILALNEQGNLRFITIAANQNGELLIPNSSQPSTAQYGLFQYMLPCPSTCPCPEGTIRLRPGGNCIEIEEL